MSDVIKSYLAKIDREFKTGRATEHTHRPALKDLIESLDTGVSATNEPKRVECGAPDFILRRDGLSIGYVETKDLGKSLDEAEDSDQLQRYKKSLPNLILTDYLEFRWFVDGQLRDSSLLGEELVALHLLESPQLTQLLTRYPVAGDNIVEKGFPKFVVYEEGQPATFTSTRRSTSRASPRRSGSFTWVATRSARNGLRIAGAGSSPSTISCTIKKLSWPWRGPGG